VIIGQNHGSIGMFFDDNQAHTIIDKIRKNFDIEILVMPEYVYCNECKTIVSVKTCPHGQHHHIKYHSPTIRTLLLNGVLPPPILMRKEISSIILSDLFPNRFENLQQIYDEIFPNAGILETHTYEDFYKELAKLYQTGSLT
ncbi:MAG: sulfate adenylyltransferase, partial [Campylobacter ureolyticus]|nr:sulfate adenylyltransferase [Campylobacter ureolyticus]